MRLCHFKSSWLLGKSTPPSCRKLRGDPQEVNGQSFTPVEQCPSQRCKVNNKGGQLHLATRGCKFVKFQEVKVQELAEEVPMGCIPRTLNVQLKGELTRALAPGDVVDITGIFLPIQFTGFRVRMNFLVFGRLEPSYVERF